MGFDIASVEKILRSDPRVSEGELAEFKIYLKDLEELQKNGYAELASPVYLALMMRACDNCRRCTSVTAMKPSHKLVKSFIKVTNADPEVKEQYMKAVDECYLEREKELSEPITTGDIP